MFNTLMSQQRIYRNNKNTNSTDLKFLFMWCSMTGNPYRMSSNPAPAYISHSVRVEVTMQRLKCCISRHSVGAIQRH